MSLKNSEIEQNLNNLYEFFIKNSLCSSHKSLSIYFCSDLNCKLGYICSECLIQNPNHFQKHLAYLIPVENKEKFFKYLKFPVKKIINEISIEKNEINIEKFYDEIKIKITNLIDKHKIQKGFEIQNLINKFYSKENVNLNEEFNNKIKKFIENGNKHEIQTFIKSLENIIREMNEKENVKKLNDDIENDIESIINKNLKSYYNLNEFMNNENKIDENKIETNENKNNENLNEINNENLNQNKIINKNKTTNNLNNNEINNENNNDFNFDFNVFYKSNDDNNKDNGYVKNEIFNYKKGFSPKLDKIKEELNENDDFQENNNIKNRLELLKEKISKLTTKVIINNNNNNSNNNNN